MVADRQAWCWSNSWELYPDLQTLRQRELTGDGIPTILEFTNWRPTIQTYFHSAYPVLTSAPTNTLIGELIPNSHNACTNVHATHNTQLM